MCNAAADSVGQAVSGDRRRDEDRKGERPNTAAGPAAQGECEQAKANDQNARELGHRKNCADQKCGKQGNENRSGSAHYSIDETEVADPAAHRQRREIGTMACGAQRRVKPGCLI